MTNLFMGNVTVAHEWIRGRIEATCEAGAATPDPVEWAYFILTLLCLGREREALKHARQFPGLHHGELERARYVAAIAAGGANEFVTCSSEAGSSYTVHELPPRDLRTWVNDTCRMLGACGQSQLGERVRRSAEWSVTHNRSQVRDAQKGSGALRTLAVKATARTPIFSIRPSVWSRSRRYFRSAAKRVAHLSERRFGYWLPYRVSSAAGDDFFASIERLSREESISTALIVGARAGSYVTEACLRGLKQNPCRPTAICMNRSRTALEELARQYSSDEQVQCPSDPTDRRWDDRRGAVHRLVIIDGSEQPSEPYAGIAFEEADIVILDDINTSVTFDIHQAVSATRGFALVDQDLARQNAYAIYRKISNGSAHTPAAARSTASIAKSARP